jgi:hypothetical protein
LEAAISINFSKTNFSANIFLNRPTSENDVVLIILGFSLAFSDTICHRATSFFPNKLMSKTKIRYSLIRHDYFSMKMISE